VGGLAAAGVADDADRGAAIDVGAREDQEIVEVAVVAADAAAVVEDDVVAEERIVAGEGDDAVRDGEREVADLAA
jgi:hypothetical protein